MVRPNHRGFHVSAVMSQRIGGRTKVRPHNADETAIAPHIMPGRPATPHNYIQTAGRLPYSLFFVSMQMVTGPSLSSSTFMSAPNSPVCTGLPNCTAMAATNFS